MWFKNLSGRMGQNLRNLSKLTEKHYNLNNCALAYTPKCVHIQAHIYNNVSS